MKSLVAGVLMFVMSMAAYSDVFTDNVYIQGEADAAYILVGDPNYKLSIPEGGSVPVSGTYIGPSGYTEITVIDAAGVKLLADKPTMPGESFVFQVTMAGNYRMISIFDGFEVQFGVTTFVSGPETPGEAIVILTTLLDDAIANGDVTVRDTFLTTRLTIIARFIDRGQTAQALLMLNQFQLEIDTQVAAGDITTDTYDILNAAAQDLFALL